MSGKIALKFFTVFALLLILDIGWIGVNLGRYQQLVEKIQSSPLELNYVGACISYSIIYTALVLFAIPYSELASDSEHTKIWTAFRNGGILGFCIYGIYDFTNLSIFANYDPMMAVIDTCWGTTLFTLVTYGSLILFPPDSRGDSDYYAKN